LSERHPKKPALPGCTVLTARQCSCPCHATGFYADGTAKHAAFERNHNEQDLGTSVFWQSLYKSVYHQCVIEKRLAKRAPAHAFSQGICPFSQENL
jgi:hypothetical protein